MRPLIRERYAPVAHVARNSPDNVVVCLMVQERCIPPVEPNYLRLLFGIQAQIVYFAGTS